MVKKIRYTIMLFIAFMTIGLCTGLGIDNTGFSLSSSTVVHADSTSTALQPKLNTIKSRMKVSKISYSKWQTTNVLSTRAKRVAATTIKLLSGAFLGKFSAIAKYISLGSVGFDILDAAKIQGASGGDVWPTVRSRKIIGKSARGTDMILGEEIYLTLYSNPGRTKVVAKSHFFYWLY